MLTYVFIFILLININQGIDDNIVSNIVDDIQQPTNITCLCTEDEQCDSNRRTCRLKNSDQACYQSWTKVPGDNTIHLSAGCVYNNFFFTQVYCNGNQTNRYIICCSDKDYCNDRDAYSGDIRKILKKKNKSDKYLFKLILKIIVLISSLLLLLILLILFLLDDIGIRNSPNELHKHQGLLNFLCPQSKNSVNAVKTTEVAIEISTSSSGCGHLSETNKLIRSYLRNKKISRSNNNRRKNWCWWLWLCLSCRWYDDDIAVKIFLSSERPSWEREVEIYKTPGLNHENILRYIAADNTDISNRIELWLATEYHENGSVYDYLMNHTITIPILIKMLFSIVDGLWRLHMPIDASDGKVAFAHRDLKTKNILVRRDLSCCIADLGLAVKEERKQENLNQESVSIDIKAVHRVGTIRYMAPEILDKKLNVQSFDSYKAADMYALGLVYWEILRRCQTTPGENDADAYELPYQTILPNNPSFEDMQDVVCIQKIRPLPSPRWKNNPILDSIFELCEDLWSEKPASRPNSCYIKRQLKQKCETIDNELLSINTKSRNEGPQTV